MKLSAGWAVPAVLVVAATAAQAQAPAQVAGRAQYQAASDVDGPYVGGPPLPPPGYYGPRPVYGPPAAYGPPPGYGPPSGYGPPILPVQEVYAVLRDNGFSPLGAPYQRGMTYVIAVVDRDGEDGKLVIDARNGRIIRFMPAFRWGGGYYEDRYAPPPPYGPPGVLPPMSPISGEPRPPISVPHMASRVPLPQPKPAVAGKPPEGAPQKSASIEAKPEAAPAPKPAAPPATVQAAAPSAPAIAASPPAVEAKPAPVIQPTKPMPKVQGLE